MVVTAQKREQSIQDVGIAITAFTGEQIDKLGLITSTDLVAMSPGVHVGGLVHFITRKPTETFEAFGDVTYGSYDQVRVEGAVSCCGNLTRTSTFCLA